MGKAGSVLDSSDLQCRACGNNLRTAARYCDACGTAVYADHGVGERKQLTVLFADVVGSMSLAATLDSERLQEIMHELFHRSAAAVNRFGGTVDKFTGDGLMALFGAPTALEDHALRAGLAALEILSAASFLAADIERRDGIWFAVRVGLNSGEVIAGHIGAGEYTAVGHPVGLAQRMESAAEPGTVRCTEATARRIGGQGIFGPLEAVTVKGASQPVFTRRLHGIHAERPAAVTPPSPLVGRDDELAILMQTLTGGRSTLVTVVGEPGVGKTRMIREFVSAATEQGCDVVSVACDAHTSSVPLHALAKLLRAALGLRGLDGPAARARAREQLEPTGLFDHDDRAALFDLLSIGDAGVAAIPESLSGREYLIEALHAVTRIGTGRRVLVVEDVHWIDTVSEEILVDFARSRDDSALILIATFRPNYGGALRDVEQTSISLHPLEQRSALTLARELIGVDATTTGLAEQITTPAGGNPFFLEEIIEDLVDRGALTGTPGNYRLSVEVESITVPASVQSVIAARIDRFTDEEKAILYTASVIGTTFDEDTLRTMVPRSVPDGLRRLIAADLIQPIRVLPTPRYSFRHPLVRAVCYEAQLFRVRADRHRRLAGLLQSQTEHDVNAEAALIAHHLNAAGEMEQSYSWYMQAAEWLHHRNLAAARSCWEQASGIADRLPIDIADRDTRRAAPRAMLAMTAWMIISSNDGDRSLDEIRALTEASGATTALALAMSGRVTSMALTEGRPRAAVALTAELLRLVDTMGGTTSQRYEVLMAIAFTNYVVCDFPKARAVAEQMRPAPPDLRADEIAPPLALLGALGVLMGDRDAGLRDLERARQITAIDPVTAAIVAGYAVDLLIVGFEQVTAPLLRHSRSMLRTAVQFGEPYGIAMAYWVHGSTLAVSGTGGLSQAVKLLHRSRAGGFDIGGSQVDAVIAAHAHLTGRLTTQQVETLTAAVEEEVGSGDLMLAGFAAAVAVTLLVSNDSSGDRARAHRLTDYISDELGRAGQPALDLWPLRCQAIIARATGDRPALRHVVDDYRNRATALEARAHMAAAGMLTRGEDAGLRGLLDVQCRTSRQINPP